MGGVNKWDEAGDAVRSVIRAYHGSPYDFDKVDMRKIGRGEGTADEGHGLYVAEHPQVAEYYRDNVGVDRNFAKMFTEGAELDPSQVMTLPSLRGGERWKVLSYWRENGQPVADLAAVDKNGSPIYVRDNGERNARAWDANEENWSAVGARPLQHLHRTLPMPHEYQAVVGERPGRVYELEINHSPEAMLDWDAPVTRQTPEVMRALNRMRSSWEPVLMPKLAPHGEVPTGEQVYRAMERGYTYPGGYSQAASRRLLEEGVPGIRYFDQLSRGAGSGTRNYVMFPGTEDSIRILRKYAIPGAVGTGVASQYEEER